MIIGIMGESGSGKTTAMRNLPPDQTIYIDADKKGLSWKGWRSNFSKEARNYIKTDQPDAVLQSLQVINSDERYQHIKYVVVDTLNGLMVADEMRRLKEKSYDKWMDLAACVYNIVDYALICRDDLTIIFLCHSQTDRDDNGYSFTRIRTSGKKLDKIILESKFTTVLLARTTQDGRHIFETQANNSTAKSPLGCFDKMEIDNDIMPVIEALKEY